MCISCAALASLWRNASKFFIIFIPSFGWLFFPLHFQCLWLSITLMCACVCVVVMQKFKICICRLFHSFHSLTISIILRFWWKKAGKKHTQKSRGWWKKSIKLHRNDRDVCGSFLKIWSWKALQFCISSTANALFCIPSHSTPRRHHHHPTAQQSSGNVIINVSTLSRLSKNFFNFHKMKLFLFAFFN